MKQGTGVTATWRKALISVLVTACMLVAAPAFALGLGQIQVKSRAGQPLLAEIPIVSSDPSELENLQARLASPETFARIGLEPPRGAVSNLVFTVALDARGNPVIRVTTSEPVEQPLLTFLVEVDWGQGRLVREYSALLDAPRTVSAPAQPAIEAAVTAPANEIVRAPAATPSPTATEPSPASVSPAPPSPVPTPTPASAAAAPGATPVPASQAAAEPVPADNAIPATPTPAAKPAAPPAAASPSGEITVAAGDTLSSIVGAQAIEGHSREQAMLALLRTNPDAFIRGNLNLIKRGAVLRMPGADELSKYSAAEARLMVREQVSQWRQMSQPTPQPAAVAGDSATPAAPVTGPETRNAAPRTAEARLEIVPRSANDSRKAGTQSGIQTGGKGDMLQQQEMQETKETLAAREAEVQELKTRVADLEKLQQDQQKLIAMKDGELAAAQRNLAANQTAATTATKPVEPAAMQPAQASAWPWWIAGLVIVLIAAWLLMRRKAARPARPAFAPATFATDSTALAAAMPAAPAAATETVASKADIASRPAWHVGDDDAATAATVPTVEVAETDAAVATAPIANASIAPMSAPVPPTPTAAGSERLELARAYLDLGDDDTARTLLKEVADGDDAVARDEAERLLRDLS